MAGEPATGKSTLIKSLVNRVGGIRSSFKYGKLRGHILNDGAWLLGVYPFGETFGGTDRLSMTVITDAIPFLGTMKETDRVLLEGDRLFNKPFLDAITKQCNAHLFLLRANAEELALRHIAREDKQSESWLRSRRTKCANLERAYPFKVLRNETEQELARNTELLLSVFCG